MRKHITVVPIDNVIIINEEPLFFELPKDNNIHAIQWHEGKGHIEWKDGTPNTELIGEAQYKQFVQTWDDLWQKEKDRLVYEATRPRTPEELKEIRTFEIKNRLNTIDFQIMRSVAEILNNTATDEDKEQFSALMAEKNSLRTELSSL